MRRTDSRALRAVSRAAAPIVGFIAVLLLTGCTATSDPTPSAATDASTAAPSSSAEATNATNPTDPASSAPAPTPTAPTIQPDGTAADNLPVFTDVMLAVHDTDDRHHGRAYIDALVDAGFDRDAMQVTRDTTTVGNPADAIQFSIEWGAECLIGQVGPSTPTPTAVVLPALPSGGCLIGQTRPIDW